MSYVYKSLEEMAQSFDIAAEQCRMDARSAPTEGAAASYRGEAEGWTRAAYILRRTTLTEPCHMEAK